MGYQLVDLVKGGFLKEYLEEDQEASTVVTPIVDQGHEVPVHGDVYTISFVTLTHDGPKGQVCLTKAKETQRGKTSGHQARNSEAVKCWPHQGNPIP